jgi:hypothetical protein
MRNTNKWSIFTIKYPEPNTVKITLGNGTVIRPFALAENKTLLDYTWNCGANIYNADERTI